MVISRQTTISLSIETKVKAIHISSEDFYKFLADRNALAAFESSGSTILREGFNRSVVCGNPFGLITCTINMRETCEGRRFWMELAEEWTDTLHEILEYGRKHLIPIYMHWDNGEVTNLLQQYHALG